MKHQQNAAAVATEASPVFTQAEADALIAAQGARIREIRTKAGLTIQDVATSTGLHPNTIGRVERGDSEATTVQLLQIARAIGVPPAKLMHFVLEDEPVSRTDDDFALVDMLDVRASAGMGALNGHHEVIGRFAFKRNWLAQKGLTPTAAKLIRARGDSMADRINNGDILLVNTAINSLTQDGIYVIELDGHDYVKLLQKDFSTGGVQVISYNPAYKPQLLGPAQAADLRISGRVVWHGGEL